MQLNSALLLEENLNTWSLEASKHTFIAIGAASTLEKARVKQRGKKIAKV